MMTWIIVFSFGRGVAQAPKSFSCGGDDTSCHDTLIAVFVGPRPQQVKSLSPARMYVIPRLLIDAHCFEVAPLLFFEQNN